MNDNKWIKVEDQLPDPHVGVLAFHCDHKVSTIRIEWTTEDGKWIFAGPYGPVTHWMPLPAPPKEEEE